MKKYIPRSVVYFYLFVMVQKRVIASYHSSVVMKYFEPDDKNIELKRQYVKSTQCVILILRYGNLGTNKLTPENKQQTVSRQLCKQK